ncbi:MAG: glycosyltransferase family 2 protein [Verrucomicrobiales bacterium]
MFSVIIPVHNSAATIGAVLDSVRAQSLSDYEVIVVDDASTDGSGELASAHPLGCRVLERTQRSGPGVARNAGANLAHGEYLAFLDADDEWFPWTLAVFSEAIRRHGNPSVVAGSARRGLTNEDIGAKGAGEIKCKMHADYFATASQPLWLGVGGVLVRREEFLKVGGFAEWDANSEDSDLWMRLGKSPGFVWIGSPTLFFYRESADSLTRRPQRISPGYLHLVRAEREGRYPGGSEARRLRRELLTRHTRAGSLTLLALGRCREAIALYSTTFLWNLSLGRVKYLVGFWMEVLGLAALRPSAVPGQS